jgi:hypothetical protein
MTLNCVLVNKDCFFVNVSYIYVNIYNESYPNRQTILPTRTVTETADRHIAPLVHITLIPRQPVFILNQYRVID